MARKSASVNLDFAFFTYLLSFYQENRRHIRSYYRDLSKKFLDYNDPEKSQSYLRQPQFEALEMYIFLKEYLDNIPVHHIFKHWSEKTGKFIDRKAVSIAGQRAGQLDMFEELTKDQYEIVFERMRSYARSYSNYIFALTMGTGKTILMATCIFYEFILANKYPKDERYCHNALVFAPDKTVLQSLREIQTFDMRLVVPPEYVNFLTTHLQFHFLDEAGTALSVLDKSRFNIIVSNTQKIILKRQSKSKTATDKLFGSGKPTYQASSVYSQYADLYDFDEPDDEDALTTNQRFEKLRRLEQLGIYVDEAHHAFGTQLANDMGVKQSSTSLRLTIDELAASLERSGTHVVACYNYTGTPYVGQEVLPEVVYAFSLQDAIQKAYLKKVQVNSYSNTRSDEFVRIAVRDFVSNCGGQRYEEMLPKMAFFAATIEELQKELRPAVEKALAEHNIPSTSILVNVGDEKLTTNDDIREFNRLDTHGSDKQFILLVGKGKEGWNCRSLFGVALFRQPKSKIFVLQATMRCLRSIGEGQQTGHIYLSADNKQILDDELQQNFRISVEEMQNAGKEKEIQKIRVVEPPVKIKLRRIHRVFQMKDKQLAPGVSLELANVDTEKYRLIHSVQEGLTETYAAQNTIETEDLTHLRQKQKFSELTLVAEISRYLNKPCLAIEDTLSLTQEGTAGILAAVNEYNELLYDWVIPRLFRELYEITEDTKTEEYEVELVKVPDKGYYEVNAAKDMIVRQSEAGAQQAAKSFHLDTYCFDSDPEKKLFWALLSEGKVHKLYFTGMLTHGQTDFFVQYIDPESHTVRSYYPDFLFQKEDGSYVIVEVKGDDKIDDPVVQAKKEFAEQMAVASGMTYRIIKGSEAQKGHYSSLLVESTYRQVPIG